MFGIDWNQDGKEDMLDDMLTYGLYEEVMKDTDESDDYGGSGSCLLFLIGMIGAIILPIAGIIQFIS